MYYQNKNNPSEKISAVRVDLNNLDALYDVLNQGSYEISTNVEPGAKSGTLRIDVQKFGRTVMEFTTREGDYFAFDERYRFFYTESAVNFEADYEPVKPSVREQILRMQDCIGRTVAELREVYFQPAVVFTDGSFVAFDLSGDPNSLDHCVVDQPIIRPIPASEAHLGQLDVLLFMGYITEAEARARRTELTTTNAEIVRRNQLADLDRLIKLYPDETRKLLTTLGADDPSAPRMMTDPDHKH